MTPDLTDPAVRAELRRLAEATVPAGVSDAGIVLPRGTVIALLDALKAADERALASEARERALEVTQGELLDVLRADLADEWYRKTFLERRIRG